MIRRSVFAVVAAMAAAVPSAQAAPISGAAQQAATEVAAGPLETVAAASDAEGRVVGMVVDRSGTATMVWERSGAGWYAAQRPPAGGWSPPQLIGCPGPSMCMEGRVGVDAAGTVTVVWDEGSERPIVQVVTKAPGAPWSTPITLTRGPGRAHGFYPQLSVAPNGAALVSWMRIAGEGSVVLRKPARRSWDRAVPTIFRHPTNEVAIAADGTVLAVGVRDRDSRTPKVVARVFRPHQGWRPTVVLGRSGGDQRLAWVAVGPQHRAAAAWTTGPSTAISPSAVIVRRMDRHFRWAKAERISPWLGDAHAPFVNDAIVEPNGRVTVTWSGHAYKASTRLPTGTWVSRRLLPSGGGFPVGGLTSNVTGALAVPWVVVHYDDATGQYREEVRASLRSPGTLAWRASAALDLTYAGTGARGDPGSRPFSVGVLPDGAAVVCWFDLHRALVARVVR